MGRNSLLAIRYFYKFFSVWSRSRFSLYLQLKVPPQVIVDRIVTCLQLPRILLHLQTRGTWKVDYVDKVSAITLRWYVIMSLIFHALPYSRLTKFTLIPSNSHRCCASSDWATYSVYRSIHTNCYLLLSRSAQLSCRQGFCQVKSCPFTECWTSYIIFRVFWHSSFLPQRFWKGSTPPESYKFTGIAIE